MGKKNIKCILLVAKALIIFTDKYFFFQRRLVIRNEGSNRKLIIQLGIEEDHKNIEI